MKIAQALKIALKKALSLQFGQMETESGTLYYDGELEVGTEVFVETEDGEMKPAADGEYNASNGDVIVVKDVKVEEIRKKEEEKPEDAASSDAEQPAEGEGGKEPATDVEQAEEPAAEPADATADEPETETLEDKVARLEGIVNSYVDGIEKILNAVAALENRIAEAENKIAALDSEPAAPEAEVEVEETAPKSRISYLRKN